MDQETHCCVLFLWFIRHRNKTKQCISITAGQKNLKETHCLREGGREKVLPPECICCCALLGVGVQYLWHIPVVGHTFPSAERGCSGTSVLNDCSTPCGSAAILKTKMSMWLAVKYLINTNAE